MQSKVMGISLKTQAQRAKSCNTATVETRDNMNILSLTWHKEFNSAHECAVGVGSSRRADGC
jgi:hypothetical protein